MTQNNPSTPVNPTPADPASATPSPKPKRRWLRRIIIGTIVLLLFIVLLLALTPTLMSTGPARSYVVGKINDNLNGHVTIADWSIGWTGGVRAEGIKVFDDANRLILEIPHVSTELSLLGAAQGRYHLGKTSIDGLSFFAERYPDGTLNFDRLLKKKTSAVAAAPERSTAAPNAAEPSAAEKTAPAEQPPAAPQKEKTKEPSKLPNVDGDIELTHSHGTIQTDSIDSTTNQPRQDSVNFTTIEGSVKIPSINGLITDSLKVVASTGGPSSGTIALDGSMQIAKNNVLLLDHLEEMNVDQTASLSTFDLAGAVGFLPPDLTQLAGMTDGKLTIHMAAGQAALFQGDLLIKNFKVGGPKLKGDTYAASTITGTLPKTTLDMTPGLGGPDNYRIRIGDGSATGGATLVIDNTAAGKPSQTTFTLAADTSTGALKRTAANAAPGGDGKMHLGADIDLAALAENLPHMLSIRPNTRLLSGHLTEGTDIAFTAAQTNVNQSLNIDRLVAEDSAEHRQITLQPVNLTLKLVDVGGGGAIPDLRDILLQLNTGAGETGGYATANVKGSSLTEVSGEVHLVLDRFQKEWSQLVDFGTMQLAGNLDLVATSKGNLLAESKPGQKGTTDANVKITGANLAVNGMQQGSTFLIPALNGGLTCRSAAPQQLAIDGSFDITGLSATVPGAAGLKNEEIKIALAMQAPEDFSTVAIPNVDITGSMLTAHITEASLRLKTGTGADAKDVPAMQKLRSMTVSISVPDLAKLQTTIDAISPPATAKPVASSATASTDRMAPLMGLAKADAKQPAAAPQPAGPTKLTGGSLNASLRLTRDNADALLIQPQIDGKAISLSKDGVPDSIGDLAMRGLITITPVAAPSLATAAATHPASQPSAVDQIASVQFTRFYLAAVGSSVVIDGSVDDLAHRRNIKNVVAEVTYNAGMIWNAMLPLMSREQQVDLKDAKVAGNYTKKFLVSGTYPAGKESYEAIVGLNASGEIVLDQFDGEGANLTAFSLPFMLAGGKARLVYADKPEGQNIPAPAHLNDGTMSLGGATLDLSKPHATLTIPAGTQLLKDVGLNPLFASTFFGKWFNNPLFEGADKAAGKCSATCNKCEQVPIDDAVNDKANQGVMDLSLTVSRIEIGDAFLTKIADAISTLKLFGSKSLAVNSLSGEIKKFNVHIEHGVTTQDLELAFGTDQRPLRLNGDVTMATRQMNMTLEFPPALFGLRGAKDAAGIKIPLSGTVNKPQFKIDKAIQQNLLGNIPGLLGKDDSSTTKPAGQDNPVNDLLDIFGKKKKKDGQ